MSRQASIVRRRQAEKAKPHPANGSTAKRQVGRQPICSRAQIMRIDPIWCFGRVPRYYWKDAKNRRDFLLWLGNRLGFRRMEDWYRLAYRDMAQHGGGSVANLSWHGSPICAVKECFPGKFSITP
jgi:hypothetical protein